MKGAITREAPAMHILDELLGVEFYLANQTPSRNGNVNAANDLNRVIELLKKRAREVQISREVISDIVNPKTGDSDQDLEFTNGVLAGVDNLLYEIGLCVCAERGWGGSAGHTDQCYHERGEPLASKPAPRLITQNAAYDLGQIIQRLAREHREECDQAVREARARGHESVPADLVIPRPPIPYIPEESDDDATDLGALAIKALHELCERGKAV